MCFKYRGQPSAAYRIAESTSHLGPMIPALLATCAAQNLEDSQGATDAGPQVRFSFWNTPIPVFESPSSDLYAPKLLRKSLPVSHPHRPSAFDTKTLQSTLRQNTMSTSGASAVR